MAKFPTIPKPAGTSLRSIFKQAIWEMLFNGQFPIKGVGNIKVEFRQGTYFITGGRTPSGGTAIACKLYDPAKTCEAGTFYKVRKADPAVTEGVDITPGGSPTLVYATPGKYLCLVATPANPTAAAMIPALPDGSGTTDPESTDPIKYWEWFSPSHVCSESGSVEV